MTYISVGLRILLSIAFLGAGGAKLAGVDMMVMTFDQIGWGQGFRYLTGAIEVIGVACRLVKLSPVASGSKPCINTTNFCLAWKENIIV